jgi:hypothetical protein
VAAALEPAALEPAAFEAAVLEALVAAVLEAAALANRSAIARDAFWPIHCESGRQRAPHRARHDVLRRLAILIHLLSAVHLHEQIEIDVEVKASAHVRDERRFGAQQHHAHHGSALPRLYHQRNHHLRLKRT